MAALAAACWRKEFGRFVERDRFFLGQVNHAYLAMQS